VLQAFQRVGKLLRNGRGNPIAGYWFRAQVRSLYIGESIIWRRICQVGYCNEAALEAFVWKAGFDGQEADG
jgi:hypothetical protein